MNNLPSISIVTPSLNQERYIQTTIESVLEQQYPKLEYLVVDGGSIDSTQDILKSYGQKLTWFVETGTNQSKAINIGWQQSIGDIIAWINSDDIYYPGTLNLVGEYFYQHPDVDMLYGEADYINRDGDILRPYPTQNFNFPALLRFTENYIPQTATFLRRDVLDKVGFLDESLDYVMDFDFWLRIGLSCKIGYVNKKFGALRLHTDAKSVAFLSMFGGELIKVYKRFFSNINLPIEILKLKKDAMANIYNRAADCAFWGKDYAKARVYAMKSWRIRAWPPRVLWLWIALGNFGGFLTQLKKKNPYLP